MNLKRKVGHIFVSIEGRFERVQHSGTKTSIYLLMFLKLYYIMSVLTVE